MPATSAYIVIILVIIIVIVVGITSVITKVIIARLLFHVRSSPLILPGRRRSGYVTARAAQAVLETWAGARNPAIPIVLNNENDISSNNSNRHAANKSAATRGRRPRLACYLGFFVPYRLPNGACMPRAGSQRYRGTFGTWQRHRDLLVSSGSWRARIAIIIIFITSIVIIFVTVVVVS